LQNVNKSLQRKPWLLPRLFRLPFIKPGSALSKTIQPAENEEPNRISNFILPATLTSFVKDGAAATHLCDTC
jgi:hypothetical protein